MTAPDPRVGEIEARLAAASKGPWEWGGPATRQYLTKGDGAFVLRCSALMHPEAHDAELIAHAPADVAYLLAELRKAHEALAAVSAIEEVLDGWDALIPFHDAEESQRWYSLGKRHAAERIRTEIAEARAAVAAAKGDKRG